MVLEKVTDEPTISKTNSDDHFSFSDSSQSTEEKEQFIEYKNDITNNNLMNRLNSDMELKQNTSTAKPKNIKKDIVRPFVNSSCDTYATFGREQGTDLTSFKNK